MIELTRLLTILLNLLRQKNNRRWPNTGIARQLSADDFQRLISTAFNRLVQEMQNHGNVLSPTHTEALKVVVFEITALATGVRTGRIGIPLPVGGGKTQAACCWSWAINHLGLPLSVVIAANKIDNLHEVHSKLIGLGVDPSDIGVIHSDSTHDLRMTDNNDKRQILLVTHARVQGGDVKLEDYGFYNDQPRSVMIYDESLIASHHWGLSFEDLMDVRNVLRGRDEVGGILSKEEVGIYHYVEDLYQLVMGERKRQNEGRSPSPITFPKLTKFTPKELVAALPDRFWFMEDTLNHHGGQARALLTDGVDGSVWYQVAVPDEVENIVVLDASLPVRSLPKIGDQVVQLQDFPENIITYETLELRPLRLPTGRKSLETLFDDSNQFHWFIAELAHVINNRLPTDEAINVWTFKRRGERDYPGRIRSALADHGVDFRATVDGRPRINILTFGMETATNEYSYARHSIFVGVLHRSWLDLNGAAVGQYRDLTVPADRLAENTDLQVSEAAHVIYQAAARSSLRRTNNGVSEGGTIWLPTATQGLLHRLENICFPGVKVIPWLTRKEDWAYGSAGYARYARTVRDALEGLPINQLSISSKDLNKQIPESDPETGKPWAERAVRDGANLLVQDPPPGWHKISRTWQRTTLANQIRTVVTSTHSGPASKVAPDQKSASTVPPWEGPDMFAGGDD